MASIVVGLACGSVVRALDVCPALNFDSYPFWNPGKIQLERAIGLRVEDRVLPARHGQRGEEELEVIGERLL